MSGAERVDVRPVNGWPTPHRREPHAALGCRSLFTAEQVQRIVLDERDAMRDLIAADDAYDEAVTALRDHHRREAEVGYIPVKLGETRALCEAMVRAQIARDKALDRVKGMS